MTHVEIEEKIAASAEDVWDCFLGSRAEELAIGVYAESIVTEGEGVGAVRVSTLLGGMGVIRERLDVLDPDRFFCRYSLIEPGPLPFSNYQGQITITALDDNNCILKLQADFVPRGVDEADSIAFYRQNNLKGISKMKSFLGIA